MVIVNSNSCYSVINSSEFNKCILNELKVSIPINIYEIIAREDSLIPFTKISSTSEEVYGFLMVCRDNKIIVPSGLLYRVIKVIKNCFPDVVFKFNNRSSMTTNSNYLLNSQLRINQIKSINVISKYKRGLLQAPTGSGKSWIIGETIKKYQGNNSLIIVPQIDLMYQMQNDLKIYLQTDNVGVIGDSIIDLQPCTVGIIDSLYSKLKHNDTSIKKFLEGVKISLWDEVHNYCNARSVLVSSYIKQDIIRFGVSATCNTQHPLLIESIIGPLHLNIPISDAINNSEIMKPEIIFHKYDQSNISISDALLNYKFTDIKNSKQAKIYNNLYDNLICNNLNRNLKAATIAKECIDNNKSVLILVSKVGTSGGISHAEIIQRVIEDYCGITIQIMHGNHKSKSRKLAFENLDKGVIPGLIASDKIVTQGVNIKSLSRLIILSAGKKENNFVQRAGRLLRTDNNKDTPQIHDFVDNLSIFNKQFKTRYQHAKFNYPGCVKINS